MTIKLKENQLKKSRNFVYLEMLLKLSAVLLWMVVGSIECLTMQGNIHRVSSKYGKRGFMTIAADNKRFRHQDESSQEKYAMNHIESIIQMRNALAGAKRENGLWNINNDNFPPRVGRGMLKEDLNERTAFPPRVGRSMTIYGFSEPVKSLPPRTGRSLMAARDAASMYGHSRSRRSVADNNDKSWAPRIGRKVGPLAPRVGRNLMTEANNGPFAPRVGRTAMTEHIQGPFAPRVGRTAMIEGKQRPLAPRVGRNLIIENSHGPFAPRVGRTAIAEKNRGPLAPRVGRTAAMGEDNQGPFAPRVGRTTMTKDDKRPLAPRVGRTAMTKEDSQGPFAPRVGRTAMTEEDNRPFAPRVGRAAMKEDSDRPLAPRVGRTATSDAKHGPSVDKTDAHGNSFLPRSGKDSGQPQQTKRQIKLYFPPGMVATGYAGKDMNDANLVAEILQALSETEYPDASQE